MHSRNFCTHNAANSNNQGMMTSSNNTKQSKLASAMMLNPLASQNEYSGMTHNDNGLRAASHVSMEHTIDAHEYQPTCKCVDCQTLLKDFTQYNILDAYVCQHLSYESRLQADFGFVPCIGGPFGHVAMRTSVDPQTNEEVQTPVPSDRYVFHMHLHHMNPVPQDVKERSYNRFFAPKTENNNNVSIPAPHSKRTNNYNNNNNYRDNTGAPAAAVRNNNKNYHSQNYNNYYGAAAAPSYQQQQSFHNNYAAQQQQYLPQYTQADVEQATAASNFTHNAARLGN